MTRPTPGVVEPAGILTPVPTPDFITELRAAIGHAPLWLTGATAVVLRDTDAGKQILLVKRSDDGAWSSVTGIIDPGEEPFEAAVREAEEEAGVVVEVERLVWVSVTDMVVYDNGDQSRYIDHTFRCRWVSGEPHPADGEASEARWFSVDDLPEMPPTHEERVRVALLNEPETKLGRLRPRTD